MPNQPSKPSCDIYGKDDVLRVDNYTLKTACAKNTTGKKGNWYEDIFLHDGTTTNHYYYGESWLDSLSALTDLLDDAYANNHKYRVDWEDGEDGFVRWYFDDVPLYEMSSKTLRSYGSTPSRLISEEPMYLILNTAVSPKFSAPCSGGPCDSIWPTNFTIDYVRVYQKEGEDRIGCSPQTHPTNDWISAHPLWYGLPWYAGLSLAEFGQLIAALLFVLFGGSILRAGASAQSLVSFASLSVISGSFVYYLLKPVFSNPAWIGVMLSFVVALPFGLNGFLFPNGTLTCTFGYFLALLVTQVVAVAEQQAMARLTSWIIVGVCVVLGFFVRNVKQIQLVAAATFGSLCCICGVALLFFDGDGFGYVASVWFMPGWLLNQQGTAKALVSSTLSMALCVCWVLLAVACVCIRMYLQRKRNQERSSYLPMVSPSGKAKREFKLSVKTKQTRAVAAENSTNVFDFANLPAPLTEFAFLPGLMQNLGTCFGFQPGNVQNQTEHLMMLLANCSRNGDDAGKTLHKKIFSNYVGWCRSLHVKSSSQIAGQEQTGAQDQAYFEELGLFFLIWGEASNFRLCPEFLCYLFHVMNTEFRNLVEHKKRGFFLQSVIEPVYGIVRSEMCKSVDHANKKNYDDFNEFFWTRDCLLCCYHSEKSDDPENPPVAMPVAERYAKFASKTYLEKRSWLHLTRSYWRVFEWHSLSFHFLVCMAYAETFNWPMSKAKHVMSSLLLAQRFWSLFKELLDFWIGYDPKLDLKERVTMCAKLMLQLTFFCVLFLFFWWSFAVVVEVGPPDIHDNVGLDWWHRYLTLGCFSLVGYVLQMCLQMVPVLSTWLRTTENVVVRSVSRAFDPLDSVFVGHDVHESQQAAFYYQVYWISLCLWKMWFSYHITIVPLIQPTYVLAHLHLGDEVSYAVTILLVAIRWLPFILIYFIDLSIWNSVWVAVTGLLSGYKQRIGIIRTFGHIRDRFMAAPDAFNKRVISQSSDAAAEVQDVDVSFKRTAKSSGSREKVALAEPLIANYGTASEAISFRRSTWHERKDQRHRKWAAFAVVWNDIIKQMREGDLVGNKEVGMLRFHIVNPNQFEREVYIPLFQVAGSMRQFFEVCSNVATMYQQSSDQASRFSAGQHLEDQIHNDLVMEEAVSETWELAVWLLHNILGAGHDMELSQVLEIVRGWSDSLEDLPACVKLQNMSKVAAELVKLVKAIKPNIKVWASLPGAQQASGPIINRSIPVPVKKSHSAANLENLLSTAEQKPKTTEVIQVNGMMQFREKLRGLLNALVGVFDAEQTGLRDALTWMMTKDSGIMWDDAYTQNQLRELASNSHLGAVLDRLVGLLELSKADAEPETEEARRRLPLFVNSIFMDIPEPPPLQDMFSWSVLTPFYSEDVMYSKKDLLDKSAFMHVDTLLYLQTLYRADWKNFVERMGSRWVEVKNPWDDNELAKEIRLWASLRGQTLMRTVQGMMFYETGIRLLAKVEDFGQKKTEQAIDELVNLKFNYVVACQIYGQQRKDNDPKAADIEFMLHRFPNLRVAYIDQERALYTSNVSFYSVLVKSNGHADDPSIDEVYRVRLPGNPVLGEGKPENQNHAIIFTRGEALQTIDMNQDGYLEEALKMRSLLQEFTKVDESGRPYTLIGLPEHIFTESVSSLASYMALQETSFVTLGQRVLNWPLRSRLHYGHPDVFDKTFFMTRGGVSKGSKGINLSEDIFAGYNNAMRGGRVTFPEYLTCGKGRDVGMQQIFKFEAKLAQGAAEQSLSRDVNRQANRLDFFRLMAFYYGGIGFYLNASMVIWAVFFLSYLQSIMSLLDLERVGTNMVQSLSSLQLALAALGFLTTCPLLATIAVSRGLKTMMRELFMMVITGGPLYFMFHIGTKQYYFGQTLLAGGAMYRATGRGFVTKHSSFDEIYRFYASSHFYAGAELFVALVLFGLNTISLNYAAVTWTLWLAVLSFLFSPFWFNPLAFEWDNVVADRRLWWKWMCGTGMHSWQTWWREENQFYKKLSIPAKLAVSFKGFLYMAMAYALAKNMELVTANRKLNNKTKDDSDTVLFPLVGLIVVSAILSLGSWALIRKGYRTRKSGWLLRVLQSVFACVCFIACVVTLMVSTVLFQQMLVVYYSLGVVACWTLAFFGADNR